MRPPRNALAATIAVVVGVVGLGVYAYVVRARYLFATPYPVGIDGYYYAIQLRALLETGHLYFPSAPLFFWLAWPAAALSDPIAATKIAAAAASALAVVPTYFIARRLSGERAPALLAAALVATSAESFYLSAEFVKQGLGLTLALGFAAAASGPLPLALLLLAGALLAHKTAFAVALLLGVPILAERRGRGAIVAVAALAVAVAVAMGVLMPHRFLSGADLSLLEHTFTSRPSFGFAVLDAPGPGPLHFGFDVARAALLAAAVLVVCAVRRQRPPLGAAGFLVLALALAVPFLDVHDTEGLAMRLRLLAFIAVGPLAALVVVRATPSLSAFARACLCLGAAAGFVLLGPVDRGEGTILAHPAVVQAARAVSVPDGATIVCPDRHLAFMTTWYTRARTRLHPPGDFRLLPRAYLSPEVVRALDDLRAHPVDGVAPARDLHPWGRDLIVLVAEPTYGWLIARAWRGRAPPGAAPSPAVPPRDP